MCCREPFFDVVDGRRSIRQFEDAPVPGPLVDRILAAAMRAPSAGNLQAYQICVVRDPVIRRRLDAASGNQGPIAAAPVVLVFCAVPSRSAAKYGAKGEQLFCVQDATIACAYAQLAAASLGLGSVWIGAVHEPEVMSAALGLSEDVWPTALLPIGYAAESPAPKSRRPLAEVVRSV